MPNDPLLELEMTMEREPPYDTPTGHVPRPIDCYLRALPGEPRFTLLGRDPDFQDLVKEWARRRQLRIDCGEAPVTDRQFVEDAVWIAQDGAMWRRKHNGIWRKDYVG